MMAVSSYMIFCLLQLFIVFGVNGSNYCQTTIESVNTSFNLCPLTIGSSGGQIKYYVVEDYRNTAVGSNTYSYKYYFNVGAALPIIPPICSNTIHKYCIQRANISCSDQNNQIIADNAWAYQVQLDSNGNAVNCEALSNEIGGTPEWNLLDENDPSYGIQLTYLNGDYSIYCNANRRFKLQFVCNDDISFIPDSIPVYEDIACEYSITIESKYGCPTECGWYDNQLCGGHGFCEYDTTNKQPHCYCFGKYEGSACTVYNEFISIPTYDSYHERSKSIYSHQFNTLGINVTYDINDFAVDVDALIIKGYGFSYNYYIGVSGPLNPLTVDSILPNYCKNISAPCIEWNGGSCLQFETDTDLLSNSALVFQTNNDTQDCFLLGRFINSTSPTWTLFDQYDGAVHGVSITISNGSWCPAGGINRKIIVNLICESDRNSIFKIPETRYLSLQSIAYEYRICEYAIDIASVIGCPSECISKEIDISDDKWGYTICSRHGICTSDTEVGYVRCLCDYGWTGIYCNISGYPPSIIPTKYIKPTNYPTIFMKPTMDPTEIMKTSNSPTKDIKLTTQSTQIIESTRVISSTKSTISWTKSTVFTSDDIANIGDNKSTKKGKEETTNSKNDAIDWNSIIAILMIVVGVVLIIMIFIFAIYKHKAAKYKYQLQQMSDNEQNVEGNENTTDNLDKGLMEDGVVQTTR